MRYSLFFLWVTALLAGPVSAQPLQSIEDAAPQVIRDFCAPLVSGAADSDPWAVVERLGARSSEVPAEVRSDARHVFDTADVGRVEIDVRDGACGLHYTGGEAAVLQVAAALSRDGWDSRPGLHGQVWRKGKLFAVTTWAQETTNGPFEGHAYVVRANDPIAIELSGWFSE